MEGIERLRKLPIADKMRLAAKGDFNGAVGRVVENAVILFDMECKDAEHVFKALADEIERDYMRLPVDADGVPIHVGDRMRNDNGLVCEVFSVFGNGFVWVDDSGELWEAYLTGKAKYRHVKPDSVKELLEELISRAYTVEKPDSAPHPVVDDSDIEEIAAKIREAVSAE